MKNIAKKNQIIITTLAIMIAVARVFKLQRQRGQKSSFFIK